MNCASAEAYVLKLVPVIEPLDIRTCWEHTPLDYFRYGEYPRFLRPVGAHQPRTAVRRVKVSHE